MTTTIKKKPSAKNVPAKKTAVAPKTKEIAKAPTRPMAVPKEKLQARQVKAAVPLQLKKTVPARKPAVVAPPKLAVVAAPAKKKATARPVKKETTAAPVPKPVQNKVRIFQIYYQPEQRQHLDPAFEPYNNEGDKNPLREFGVFRKLLDSEVGRKAEYWGALSWKFSQKTLMTGDQLMKVIDGNPGYDVYYCNPYPDLEALYHNLWLQGETAHPNFLILCQEFMRAAGLDEKVIFQMSPSSNFAASNYFVATTEFWREYVEYITSLIEQAENGMSSTAKAMIYSAAADQRGMHANANYMPFIIERLLTVFLTKNKEKFRTYKVLCEQKEEKLNVHLKLLRQMKDVAVSSKSPWMAACWVNYRNLYLQQFHGKDWCNRYLRDITPSSIVFS